MIEIISWTFIKKKGNENIVSYFSLRDVAPQPFDAVHWEKQEKQKL